VHLRVYEERAKWPCTTQSSSVEETQQLEAVHAHSVDEEVAVDNEESSTITKRWIPRCTASTRAVISGWYRFEQGRWIINYRAC